jgi:MscS family membrane protein
VLTWTLVALAVLQLISTFLKVPIASTLAFGGLGGIAFGLASKGIFENFLGGLSILVSEPFVPGDMVHFEVSHFCTYISINTYIYVCICIYDMFV